MIFINGNAYDHSSHRILVDGIFPLKGLKKLDYSQAREGGEYFHGTSQIPLAESEGKIVPGDISMEMAVEQWETFQLYLGVGGVGFMVRRFDMAVARVKRINGIPGPTSTDLIKGAKLTNWSTSTDDAGGVTMVTLTAKPLLIMPNGAPPTLDNPIF